MSTRIRLRLSPARVACMAGLLIGFLGIACWIARGAAPTQTGFLVSALLGGIVFPFAASPFEWLVHRYVYHRRIFSVTRRIFVIHHRGHHRIIFPTWRYVTNGPVRRHPILSPSESELHDSMGRNLLIKLSHFSFYMTLGCACIWLPAWLLTGNAGFAVGLIVANIVISDLFVRVHDAIHYPGIHRLIEAQPWFRFLENHHYIHHVDTEANVNFLLPLADWLFGTMRRSLTEEELRIHGPLAEAKAHLVGRSEPARQVAHPRRTEHQVV